MAGICWQNRKTSVAFQEIRRPRWAPPPAMFICCPVVTAETFVGLSSAGAEGIGSGKAEAPAGLVAALGHALENTTSAFSDPPVAAPFRSHFDDCPGTHTGFCFHGTCRFLVQENLAACICHSGYIGSRCEYADLLAVVADNQKKQTITALVVVSVVACVMLIVVCVLIHCCSLRKQCEWCRTLFCRHEKPSGLLKGGASCCQSETVV